jgi:uncharacterized lipoprotein YddW (UPF0748 family)
LLLFTFSQSANAFNRVGLWVVRDDVVTAEEIDRLFEFAENNHITDIFFQVRGRGDAYYDSRFIKKTERIPDPDFDPLQYACAKALVSPVKIHAWFNTYLLYSNHYALPPNEHIFNLFPEWLEIGNDGIPDNIRLYQTPRPRWYEGAFLSPIHPKVNDYLLILVRELMSKYMLDGIHFDYLRYQNNLFGFNPDGRAIFKEETGVDPALYMKGGKGPRREDFFKLYDQYRMDAITDFLSGVQKANQELIFPLEISAAVKSNPLRAKIDYFQNWESWLLTGKLSFVVSMLYETNLQRFEKELQKIKSAIPPEHRSKVWGGIGVWNQDWQDAAQKITRLRYHNFENMVFFSWKILRDDPDYFRSLEKFIN